MNGKSSRRIIFYILIAVLIVALVLTFLKPLAGQSYNKFTDLVNEFKDENVESFSINENGKITIKNRQGITKSYKFTGIGYNYFMEHYGELINEQWETGKIDNYNFEQPSSSGSWLPYLPYALLIGISIVALVVFMRTAGGRGGPMNNFGKARTKTGLDEKKRVLFRDVAGAEEEKEELKEIVDFLKDPGKYTRLGARIPHGVLLVGPPGTGKTLLAKAVAGEAGVPFFSISGSDFVEMYVGVGASRVRDLFENAKKYPASIIFIDEIDAVGRHRGAGLGGGHDEREQTLNQLLVEMDGFGSGSAVIVMAATNRPDILDPALLRPGRFDRQVNVGLPDIKGRLDILKIHAQGKPFENGVSLEKVAKTTVGFTGADLANLLNEAALLAARRSKNLIGEREIEDAAIKVMVGTEKKSRVVTEKEKKNTAYHEAGHAVLTKLLRPDEEVHQISVIPTGRAGGYTISRPKEDNYFYSKTDMFNMIVELLGGRMSEKIYFGDYFTGPSNDIMRATSIARNMVTRYGMSEKIGPMVLGSEHDEDEVFLGRDFNSQKSYSESTATVVDDEIRKIITDAEQLAEKLLRENGDKLQLIVDYLMKHEIMDEYQFGAVMDSEVFTVEEIEKLVEERKLRSEKENEEKARRNAEEQARREAEERRRISELSGIPMPPFGGGNDNGSFGGNDDEKRQ